jgi:hypothetical protein
LTDPWGFIDAAAAADVGAMTASACGPMPPVRLAHPATAPTENIGPISALGDLEKVVFNL